MPRPEVFNRKDIVQKVQQVFWAKGYNGTSMQDLVDATGLNRSSIYNSFGSKHELFMLSLKEYQEQSSANLDQLRLKAKTPLEVLRSLFEMAVHQISGDHKNKGCMLVNCATELANQEAEVQHWLAGSNEKMQGKFADLLEAARDEGELAADTDTRVLSHFLLMSLQGLRVNGLTNRNPKLLSAMVDQVFKNIA